MQRNETKRNPGCHPRRQVDHGRDRNQRGNGRHRRPYRRPHRRPSAEAFRRCGDVGAPGPVGEPDFRSDKKGWSLDPRCADCVAHYRQCIRKRSVRSGVTYGATPPTSEQGKNAFVAATSGARAMRTCGTRNSNRYCASSLNECARKMRRGWRPRMYGRWPRRAPLLFAAADLVAAS